MENRLRPLLRKAKDRIIELFFVDASHFVYGGFCGRLLCKIRRWIRTPDGRKRHNVLGALNFISKKIEFVANNEYITSVQVVELMEKIAKKYCGRLIVLVLDNARYQRCRLVVEKAGLLGIQLEFLPPYAPNLNLIERFWKFVKANVLNASSLNTFGFFCKIIDDFVAYAYIKHKPKMDSLITDNFQLFDGVVVNSIRSFH